MALKSKLTKEEFNKLSEVLKQEYIADADGGYKLDISDAEDIGALQRALIRERDAAGTSKKRVAELEQQLEELNSSDARKKGDIATLEKGWKKQLDDSRTEAEGKISKLSNFLQKSLIDNVALSLASKLSKNSPVLLMPHIKSRLVADFDGDEPVTKILDKNGKPSNLSLSDLEQEFVANKDFASIITVTKASGGAGNKQTGGGAPNTNSEQKPADLSKLGPKDLAARITENKANQQGT